MRPPTLAVLVILATLGKIQVAFGDYEENGEAGNNENEGGMEGGMEEGNMDEGVGERRGARNYGMHNFLKEKRRLNQGRTLFLRSPSPDGAKMTDSLENESITPDHRKYFEEGGFDNEDSSESNESNMFQTNPKSKRMSKLLSKYQRKSEDGEGDADGFQSNEEGAFLAPPKLKRRFRVPARYQALRVNSDEDGSSSSEMAVKPKLKRRFTVPARYRHQALRVNSDEDSSSSSEMELTPKLKRRFRVPARYRYQALRVNSDEDGSSSSEMEVKPKLKRRFKWLSKFHRKADDSEDDPHEDDDIPDPDSNSGQDSNQIQPNVRPNVKRRFKWLSKFHRKADDSEDDPHEDDDIPDEDSNSGQDSNQIQPNVRPNVKRRFKLKRGPVFFNKYYRKAEAGVDTEPTEADKDLQTSSSDDEPGEENGSLEIYPPNRKAEATHTESVDSSGKILVKHNRKAAMGPNMDEENLDQSTLEDESGESKSEPEQASRKAVGETNELSSILTDLAETQPDGNDNDKSLNLKRRKAAHIDVDSEPASEVSDDRIVVEAAKKRRKPIVVKAPNLDSDSDSSYESNTEHDISDDTASHPEDINVSKKLKRSSLKFPSRNNENEDSISDDKNAAQLDRAIDQIVASQNKRSVKRSSYKLPNQDSDSDEAYSFETNHYKKSVKRNHLKVPNKSSESDGGSSDSSPEIHYYKKGVKRNHYKVPNSSESDESNSDSSADNKYYHKKNVKRNYYKIPNKSSESDESNGDSSADNKYYKKSVKRSSHKVSHKNSENDENNSNSSEEDRDASQLEKIINGMHSLEDIPYKPHPLPLSKRSRASRPGQTLRSNKKLVRKQLENFVGKFVIDYLVTRLRSAKRRLLQDLSNSQVK